MDNFLTGTHATFLFICTKYNTSSICIVEDENHFILGCQGKYIKKMYYCRVQSAYKLVRFSTVMNINRLNNLRILIKSAVAFRV